MKLLKKICLFALALVLPATTFFLVACFVSTQRYDLARSVTTQDWLLIWQDPAEVTRGIGQNPDFRIRAGQPIFGYEAPLSNYQQIWTLGRSGDPRGGLDVPENADSIKEWIDDEAAVRYFLPLYDDEGELQDSLLVWREQHTTLIAHSFNQGYADYLDAKRRFENYLAFADKPVTSTQVYWTWIGAFILGETDKGGFGKFFSDFGVSPGLSLPYNYEELAGRVIPEAELIQIVEALYAAVTDIGETEIFVPEDDFQEHD